MAVIHPKHRRIPRTLLRTKLFKNAKLDDKVILGMHLFELIVILILTAAAATVAVFLPTSLHNENVEMTEKETVVEETIEKDVNVEATSEAIATPEKQGSAWAWAAERDR